MGGNNPNLKSSMGHDVMPGASLRVWRDYFPNARIIGLDIDKDLLFSEDRIETFYVDQTSRESIMDFLNKASLSESSAIDIVIDDGLHEFHAGRLLFENLIDALSDDGVYFIEDVKQEDVILYSEFFADLSSKYHAQIVNLYRPNYRLKNNSLIVVRKKVNGRIGK